ncbi:iron(III) transport system permease protein [Paenibacillus shirakamiensis]|uniref:Iron(III) transport system permease protein n=1 Tax=Paenibacillus shirakamiensis TaxID=1265935 RepID=A0ABS4JIE8_9BACL|nr:putative 2-aminoethylphosphonate ABC transporter permease subunit [Paenibacillus shirakamiensis]MBP2000339.1 iron(III) transport system permease protein [Paenibacillus shirakamiensis]
MRTMSEVLPRSWKEGRGKEAWIQRLSLLLLIVALFIAILAPLLTLFSKAFVNAKGQYIGLANFTTYFETGAFVQSLQNTSFVSFTTACISVLLALVFAFALTRTGIRGKRIFKSIAMLPLFAPTMMHGIGLTYLFGHQGLITTGFFGHLPFSWNVELYGPFGIIVSEVIYTFPQAYLILLVSLAFADQQLYEAAEMLGASRIKSFLTVTIPNIKYGLISSFFVCFTLSFTDFGAPKVVGGQYNVLATDIYKQVIGQQNMSMGAAVGIILTIPAILAFIVDRIVERKQKSTMNAKSMPYRIRPHKMRDALLFIFCCLVSAAITLLILTVFAAAFIKTWPYQMSFTWAHFNFSQTAGEGLQPFWTSIQVAAWTACVGTVATFIGAYLLEKINGYKLLRQIGYFLSILPLALPGLALGLAYIFFFNQPSNPLHGLYGTIWILVLVNLAHFYSVAFITATSALKKLDAEIEMASLSLGVPFYKTFYRITVPICLPAILEMGMYYFINSMVTVSAVMFLYAADLKLAPISIVNMEDAGDIAPAAAMSLLIVLTNMAVRMIYELATRQIRKKSSAWQNR